MSWHYLHKGKLVENPEWLNKQMAYSGTRAILDGKEPTEGQKRAMGKFNPSQAIRQHSQKGRDTE